MRLAKKNCLLSGAADLRIVFFFFSKRDSTNPLCANVDAGLGAMTESFG